MYGEGGYIDMNVRGGSGEETASLETVQFRDAQTFKSARREGTRKYLNKTFGQ